MAGIKVVCKICGNIFDWNDQWPDGLKRCPLCGILFGEQTPTSELRQSIQRRTDQGDADLAAR